MKKPSEYDFYCYSGTLAPCLLFLLHRPLEQVLQHPVIPGQLCSFPLCSQNVTALASVADKSWPDCLDSAINLFQLQYEARCVLSSIKKTPKNQNQVFTLFWLINTNGIWKGFSNAALCLWPDWKSYRKGDSAAHLQSLSLPSVVQYESYWHYCLGDRTQAIVSDLYLERNSRK